MLHIVLCGACGDNVSVQVYMRVNKYDKQVFSSVISVFHLNHIFCYV